MRRRQVILGGPVVLATLLASRTSVAAGRAPIDQSVDRPFKRRISLIARDGPPFEVLLSTSSVYQGGALRVRTTIGTAGTATLFGREYALAPANGALEGYLGIGVSDPPGPARIGVRVENGSFVEEVILAATVLRTDWTVDYITLPPPEPPDPNAPPPPPPPPEEEPLLPGIFAGRTPRKWSGRWLAPLPQPLRVTGYFGEQRSFNGGPVQGHHGGTDFGADFGTPISSTNAGTIVMSGRYRTRGNLVVVDHGAGIMSLYGHMQEIAAALGEPVAAGAVIGYVGSTGLSTGAHLHWELSVSGVLVDGLRWLDGSQGF